jgi:hypothetical protein
MVEEETSGGSRRFAFWAGLLGLAAEVPWFLLNNPAFLAQQASAGAGPWAWDKLATTLGGGMLLSAGLGNVLMPEDELASLWSNFSCAMGVAVMFGAAICSSMGSAVGGFQFLIYGACIFCAGLFLRGGGVEGNTEKPRRAVKHGGRILPSATGVLVALLAAVAIPPYAGIPLAITLLLAVVGMAWPLRGGRGGKLLLAAALFPLVVAGVAVLARLIISGIL